MAREHIVASFFPNAERFQFDDCTFVASPQINTQSSSSLSPASTTALPTPPVASRIHLERMRAESAPEIYARELLLAKRGYPLWKPKTQDARLPSTYKQEGVQIGDVGILNEFGGFSYLFNIFHAADHPNNIGRVPPNFRCFPVEERLDVEEDAEEFELGAHVTSEASQISKSSLPFLHGPGSSRGCGRRIDHQEWTALLNYTADYAQSWYDYVNGDRAQGGLSRGVHKGLYLVTGCDKARAWGVASFTDAQPPDRMVCLEFVPKRPTTGAAPGYRFRLGNFARYSSGADQRPSGCVFLRGFRIAVRDRPKNPFIPFSSIEVTAISDMYSGAGTRMGSAETASHTGSNVAEGRTTGYQSGFPVRYEVYHPLDVVNEWILNNYDEVEMAITHDEDWTSTIQEGTTEMPRDSELIESAKKNLRIVQGERCTYACIRRSQKNIVQNRTRAGDATPMTLTQLELLGEHCPDTLDVMSNLSLIYQDRGKTEEAEKLQEKALLLQNKLLGEHHPDTLSSMNNLALAYQAHGKTEQAEKLQEKVLSLQKTILGEYHPDTFMSMINLALTYQNHGKTKQAEMLHKKVLSLRKTILGEHHPDTLTSMNNLALACQARGKTEQAEKLHKKVLLLRKELLGELHPDTLTSMDNLALTYQARGKTEEAKKLQETIVSLQKELAGEDHPDTLTSMNNLALTYQACGRTEQAEELQEKVLLLRKKLLGEHHPDTLTSMNNLASAYQARGKTEQAEMLHKKVLLFRQELLGEHPSTQPL
ncbi:hypothetical protein D9757_009659 [Collybiopsis confluens]|uniref:Uncharacterized protein n=1 Tax=Collybiopsis confluens TaxID=2823264 RepID=A0A8H5LZP8_9AGAR|nr:hypothetical protein D9757_009659 [Collybiopsis confluens]